jgi:hypothetical protein
MIKLLVIILIILSGVFPVTSRAEQKEIVEEVEVKWWLVPVFAVGKDGKAILDLKAQDLEVWLNGNRLTTFEFYKRTYGVTGEQGSQPPPDAASVTPPLPEKIQEKLVVLLFDLTICSRSSLRGAKLIAEKIITEADKDTRIIILSIEKFAGLKLIGEGGSDKEKLIKMVRSGNKVNRPLGFGRLHLSAFSSGGKYSGGELAFFGEVSGSYLKRITEGFFNSIDTLYLYLNSLSINKYVYFFTEGIPDGIMGTGQGSRSYYYRYLKEAARQLGRCGAMLFIINSSGTRVDSPFSRSGENSLRYLAKESGGTYLAGYNEKIVQKLENLHRAYYEISFPDVPGLKGNLRQVSIVSKRKGIHIHTLNSLEKSKSYLQMNDLEKELLAINLVTQQSLLKNLISTYNVRLDDTRAETDKVVYVITLPPSFLNRDIDLYKIRIANEKDKNGTLVMSEVEGIEKETLVPGKNQMEISFKTVKSTQSAGKKESREVFTYFVLIDGKGNRARLHGVIDIEPDPELREN